MPLDADQPGPPAAPQPIEFTPQHHGGRWVVGPVEQQGDTPEVAGFQPSGPAGGGQAGQDRGLAEGGLRPGPAPLRQGPRHRHSHGPIAALHHAWQAELRSSGFGGGQGRHPAQLGPEPSGFRFEHGGDLRLLGSTERQAAGAEHPGLLPCDRGQIGAEVFAVIEADGSEAHHGAVRMGRGGVEPAPQTHFEHAEIEVGQGETIEGRGGEPFEGGELVGCGDRPPAGQVGAEGGRCDPAVVELDPLAPAHQVGGAVDAAAQACRPQDGVEEGGDRTLAVGASHLHGAEPPFRVPAGGEGPLQPCKAQVHAAAGEGLQEVIEIHRFR